MIVDAHVQPDDLKAPVRGDPQEFANQLLAVALPTRHRCHDNSRQMRTTVPFVRELPEGDYRFLDQAYGGSRRQVQLFDKACHLEWKRKGGPCPQRTVVG